jgi:hypothetical protein
MAISLARPYARVNSMLATLAQAISSTNATDESSTSSAPAHIAYDSPIRTGASGWDTLPLLLAEIERFSLKNAHNVIRTTSMRAILTIFPRPAPHELDAPKDRASMVLEPSSGSAPATVESRVIEKLLAELDARAVSRVPGPYLMERSPSRRHVAWLRGLWAALWVMSIVLCVFVVKYIDRGATSQAFDPAQARSMDHLANSIGDQNKQFARMIDSVETLANSVASSSVRTTAMQAVLRRLGHESAQAADILPHRPAAPVAPVSAPPSQEPAAQLSMGGHHHDPIEDVIAPRNAIVHHTENGVMDYWLMPRVVSGARSMIKVFPISQTNLGIFVHSFDEVRDYVVTSSGDWLAASANH